MAISAFQRNQQLPFRDLNSDQGLKNCLSETQIQTHDTKMSFRDLRLVSKLNNCLTETYVKTHDTLIAFQRL